MNIQDVTNYNLSYELLLDAVKEFRGFLTGVGGSNELLTFTNVDSLQKLSITKNAQDLTLDNDALAESVRNDIMPRLLDRTTGNYFLKDIIQGKVNMASPVIMKELAQEGEGLGDFIKIIYEDIGVPHGVGIDMQVLNRSEVDLSGRLSGLAENSGMKFEEGTASIREMCTTSFPLSQEKLEAQEAIQEVERRDWEAGIGTSPPMLMGTVTLEGGSPYVNSSDEDTGQLPGLEPDKIKMPSLGAIVLRDPKMGIFSRNQSHLSVFFNAITAVEMSRCVPYIDIRVISEKYNDKKAPDMNLVSYMRFVRGKIGGEYVLDESIGLNGATPVNSGQDGDVAEAYMEGKNISYMNIFTSPQMLSNGDINKDPNSMLMFGPVGKKSSGAVLEPIMPMLTLQDMQVSISGNGYGLMASKVASLNLTLHDRSRLRDIAPLVAQNQFATTKMIIDYGWNHPEGGPTSTNAIGKYLNALKDVGVYTVRKTGYSFGAGNTVSIQVDLACSGFVQAKSVSVGVGKQVPLGLLEDQIELIVDGIVNLMDTTGKSNAKHPELIQKLRANQRSARSSIATIDFRDYQEFIKKTLRPGSPDAMQALPQDIRKALTHITTKNGSDDKSKEGAEDNQQKTTPHFFNTKITELINGKLDALLLTPDPFSSLYARGYIPKKNTQKEYMDELGRDLRGQLVGDKPGEATLCVSLGKILTQFIGHSLAMCGLYDEVQMVFYPLNHQAAGARKHTTASFPIPFEKFKKVVKERLSKSSRISTEAFFNLISDKIMADKMLQPYGFAAKGCFEEVDAYKSKKQEEIDEEVKNQYEADAGSGTWAKATEEQQKAAHDNYRKSIAIDAKNQISEACTLIYEGDGMDWLTEPKFVPPNLSMYFEVAPVIDTNGTSKFLDRLGWAYENSSRNVRDILFKKSSSGLNEGKSILRIHVYDEETVSSPTELVLNNMLKEGLTGKLIGNLPNMVGNTDTAIEDEIAVISEYGENVKYSEIKNFVKRAYPSITYGSANSNVKSISVTATTSGELANVLMAESYGKLRAKAQTGHADEGQFEDFITFSGEVNLTCLGMPMIGRGENIFIDFGTNTSLDNIYSVKSITHALKSGEFTTTLALVPSNIGAIGSFRDKLSQKLEAITKPKP